MAFVAAFVVVAAGLMVVIFGLYAAGVRGKTEALAQSIGERLSAATEFGLSLKSFSGLDRRSPPIAGSTPTSPGWR